MEYRLQEGSLEIPTDWQDQSLNVLQAHGNEAFNLVINRDPVPKGEDPEAYLAAQRASFAAELNGYTLLEKTSLNNPALAGDALEYNWESPEGRMYQFNALCLHGRQLLSFTFTSPRPFSEVQRKRCLAVLNSFQPREA